MLLFHLLAQAAIIAAPDAAALNSPLLAHEPEMLMVDALPMLRTAAEPE